MLRVGVEQLVPRPGPWQPQAVATSRRRRTVLDDDDQVLRPAGLASAAQPGHDRGIGRPLAVDPFEPLRVRIPGPQRRRRVVQGREVREEARIGGACGIAFCLVPRQRTVVVPLGVGRQLGAHEEQLLARLADLVGEQRTQARELLRTGAGHLPQQRALLVDHLVVRQRHHPSLGVQVEAAEGDLTPVAPALRGPLPEVDQRVVREEAERVVHPAEVPLEVEAEAALDHGQADAGEIGRLLGDGDDTGHPVSGALVELPQERDRLEVVVAAEGVRPPFALLARVVQVQHRGHRVHPKAVDVVLLQPVAGIADQEAANLLPAEVEDEGAPFRMLPAQRVGILVQVRAVEAHEPVGVPREVGWDPVEDHADPGPMQQVDHAPQLIRRPIARGRSVEGRHLVAP